jgi:hypothetical protein
MAEQILDPYATLGVGRDAGPRELARRLCFEGELAGEEGFEPSIS